MTTIADLASLTGVAASWRNAEGQEQQVSDMALAAILTALGYPAESQVDRLRSAERVIAEGQVPPRFVSADAGLPIALPATLAGSCAKLLTEDGSERRLGIADNMLDAVAELGYHRLQIGIHELTLAVAPRACVSLPRARLWGPSVQIPALRNATNRPFGDLGTLADTVASFAGHGADAVAISPVHALLPGDGRRYSPYSPSSRLFYNGVLADPELSQLAGFPEEAGGALIEWKSAVPQRLSSLRKIHAELDAEAVARVDMWAAKYGTALHLHALHDALHLHFRDSAESWRGWPQIFHDPCGPAVRQFAQEHREELSFHTFVQWLAADNLATVQAGAVAVGMAIGLIADLAVGSDPGGSDAWTMRGSMLDGLSIGAPPDPLGPDGQNWGLTSFSPAGLRDSGFAPWIAMVRTALRHAGGLRIDHGFGLQRLWVVPEGEPAQYGTYLSYPLRDLLRLIALESYRSGAVIIAEDLGTHPEGFAEALAARGLYGMRVLWFERDSAGAFHRADAFEPTSVAMSGTHDTPTVAGWWRGVDLDWNDRLGRKTASIADRERDRALLWSTIGEGAQPQPHEPVPVVDAAVRHVGVSAAHLAIIPLEDILAAEEQPNIPGTLDEHPNWRRRQSAPLGALICEPATLARIIALDEARKT